MVKSPHRFTSHETFGSGCKLVAANGKLVFVFVLFNSNLILPLLTQKICISYGKFVMNILFDDPWR